MIERLTPQALRALFSQESEFAVIDVRERGLFSRGHLLAASNLPLSRLELLVGPVVPNKAATIVLCDDGDGVAVRAADTLAQMGYEKLALLDGGNCAWVVSGGALFSGVNVPGKAFGEFIECTMETPRISAVELKRRLDTGLPTLLLDVRPPAEHADYCVPGAVNCPGGDLVHRLFDSRIPPDAMIVTHCAGRTRSIIAAQTLRNAGVPNPAVALENGTMAWLLARYDLEKGASRPLPPSDPAGLARARTAARALAKFHAVRSIEAAALERDDGRTLCLIDVRSAEEYRQGSLAGARHVPGGQLIQNGDDYLVTRNARVVLIDSDRIRAPMTASWLKQMGWKDVCTVSIDPDTSGLCPHREPHRALGPLVSPMDARDAMARGEAIVVDIRPSAQHWRGHVAGSLFINRADIAGHRARFAQSRSVIVVTDDPAYGALVRRDLAGICTDVRVLDGGYEAWVRDGLPVLRDQGNFASPPVDVYVEGEDFSDPVIVERENRRYLDWEVGLLHQLKGDPAAPYASRL